MDEFTERIATLDDVISEARMGPAFGDSRRQVLLEQLQSAHEELRVADEELRVQQEELHLARGDGLIRQWQHERLLGALPCPTLVTNADGAIDVVNASGAAMLGVPINRLVRRPFQSFIAADERRSVRRDLSQAVRAEGQFRRVLTVVPRAAEPVTVDVVAVAQRHPRTREVKVTWLLLQPSGEQATPTPPAAATQAEPPQVGGRGNTAIAEAILGLTQLPLQQDHRDRMLQAAASLCQHALGDAAVASLTVGEPLAPERLATTSKLAQRIDGAQIVAGQGPCQLAWRQQELVYSNSLEHDSRWPKLADYLHGVATTWVIACPMMVGHKVVGALNVYGMSAQSPLEHTATVELLSAAVGAILHELQLKAQLRETARSLEVGLTSRATIDQAKGIIMAAERCGPEDAFRRLVSMSSHQNRKVRDLAVELVEQVSTDDAS